MDVGPAPVQVNFAVRDLDQTLAFYRLLGWEIDAPPSSPHAVARFDNGISVEFDQTDFMAAWNSGFDGTTGGSTILGLSVTDRDAVDAVYERMTGAGYHGSQPPHDAFWGARFAIVADPDGNPVGLMSPAEEQHRFWPPMPPPPATGP